LAELGASIAEHGLLQPIVVSDVGGGAYELVAGERRLRASKLAGLKTISAIVRDYGQQQKLELALIENVQRADLNPIEAGAAYRQLADEFHLTLDQIGERVGLQVPATQWQPVLLARPMVGQSWRLPIRPPRSNYYII
jgi:ParB family transcriptional regulator, chromosome partitioning protein